MGVWNPLAGFRWYGHFFGTEEHLVEVVYCVVDRRNRRLEIEYWRVEVLPDDSLVFIPVCLCIDGCWVRRNDDGFGGDGKDDWNVIAASLAARRHIHHIRWSWYHVVVPSRMSICQYKVGDSAAIVIIEGLEVGAEMRPFPPLDALGQLVPNCVRPST